MPSQKQFTRSDDTKSVVLVANKDPNAVLAKAIGPRFVEYRKRFEAATKMETAWDYPTHIDFEFTYGCNLKCAMCIFSLPPEKRPKEPAPGERKLSVDLIRRVITEGVPHGLRSIGAMFFNEPLLSPDVLDTFAWARGQGIVDTYLGTNGTLMDEAAAIKILDSGVTRVTISIDAASRETYKAIRKGGDYDVVVANILRLLELRAKRSSTVPIIRISFVRMSTNEHEEQRFIDFWKDKVDYYAIQEYISISDEKKDLASKKRMENRTFRCPQPFQRAVIRSDGTILPCCVQYGIDLPLGNAYKDSMYEVWHGEKIQRLRDAHKNHRYDTIAACKRCAFSLGVE